MPNETNSANAGKVALMAIMNATYTYAAYYPTNIPRSPGGPYVDIRSISIVDSSTHTAHADMDVRLRATAPLLCPGHSDTVLRHVLTTEFGYFPVTRPTTVVYRPDDTCQFDLVQPGAPGLQASTNLLYMAAGSVLAFTTKRETPLEDLPTSDKLLVQNTGDGGSVGLRIKGEQISIWFAANGVAGHSFYLEYKRNGDGRGFSWSITVRSMSAPDSNRGLHGSSIFNPKLDTSTWLHRRHCTWMGPLLRAESVQVLITCSLIILTCLSWFAWVLHTFLASRRVRTRRQNAQQELALAGVPVPVGVPEDVTQGATHMPLAIAQPLTVPTATATASQTTYSHALRHAVRTVR